MIAFFLDLHILRSFHLFETASLIFAVPSKVDVVVQRTRKLSLVAMPGPGLVLATFNRKFRRLHVYLLYRSIRVDIYHWLLL